MPEHPPATTETVEHLVRAKLAEALGGRRGIIESAVPTLAFTLAYVTTHDLRLALTLSIAITVGLLIVRLIQRSSVQFVLNALFGIGIGAFFVYRSAQGGGDEGDQALAYFLPGILYNAGYSAVMVLSVIAGWPLVGFMVGSVTGDPTGWRADPAMRKLCARLTWLLAAPCVLRVLVQGPIYLGGKQALMPDDVAVATLGAAKLALGWPLQVAAFAAMAWLLSRNKTPVAQPTAD